MNKTPAINFSYRRNPVEARIIADGRNIPFINHAKYLGVIFDKLITWRMHTETIAAKAFRMFVFTPFTKLDSSFNIKLTLRKAPIRSIMTHASPA
jgi:hypothetical protein